MVKHLRKHNTGRRKNRIHFANIQFPYKLLGPDLEEVGEEIRKLTQGNLCVVIGPAPGLTSQPLSTPCPLPLFLTPQNLACPLQPPGSQRPKKTATSVPAPLVLALVSAPQAHAGYPRLFH